MAQPSFEFALGRISVLSTHLLSASQLRRIAEAGSTKEAQKLLLETGYGENAATEQELATGEIDFIIRGQLQLTRKRIKELTPDPELTGLFLLPVDTHNIKALLKARLLGISADEILRDGGNFPLDTLKDMIQTKYYEDLPPVYCDTLNEIEAELGREADPLVFSAMVDGAMFRHAKAVMDEKHEKGFIRAYFSLWADFQNTLSLIRAQNLHWELSQLRLVLVDAGEIPRTVFEECLDTPPEQLGARLNQGAHGADLVQAINEFAQTGELGIIARRMQEGKMQIIRLAKWETDSLGPIVGYLFAREAEAEALRLILGLLPAALKQSCLKSTHKIAKLGRKDMDKNKIAVVGDPSSVMIFKAVGFDVFYEQEPDQIKRRLHTLADEGYVVIYITEMAASLAADVIDEYATATFPAIIPIPAGSKSLGLGMKRVKENVEKAVGADILFKEG